MAYLAEHAKRLIRAEDDRFRIAHAAAKVVVPVALVAAAATTTSCADIGEGAVPTAAVINPTVAVHNCSPSIVSRARQIGGTPLALAEVAFQTWLGAPVKSQSRSGSGGGYAAVVPYPTTRNASETYGVTAGGGNDALLATLTGFDSSNCKVTSFTLTWQNAPSDEVYHQGDQPLLVTAPQVASDIAAAG